MSAGRVGVIYVELDMDRSRFIGAQKAVYDDAVSTSLKIEQNYKSLGIKSAAYFDVLQQRASNAYTMIANKAGESAASQVRAHAAMVAQINATKVDMTQNSLFDALGVKSQAMIEAQKAALLSNHKELLQSGQTTATDRMNLEASTNAKILALDNELNAGKIANDKAAMASDKARWDSLGIRSTAAIKEQMETVRSSAATQQAIYAKGSQDWVNIERAKNDKLKALNKEMVGDHDLSLAAMTRSVLRFYAAFYVAQVAIDAMLSPLKKGFDAVEQLNTGIAETAAMVMSFSERPAGMSFEDQWENALKYSTALVPVLEQIAAKTLLSGQETIALSNAFARNKVFLDAQNKAQIEGFIRISNALPLMTKGQEIMRQINTEITALMSGSSQPSAMLLKNLQAIPGFSKENLKLWQEQNTVLEHMGELLKGFGPATTIIEQQWTAVKTEIDTTATQILRGIMTPAYESIIESTKELNEWLIKNKEDIADWGVAMHMNAIRVAQAFLLIATQIDKIGGTMTQMQMLLYGPGMMMGAESSTKRFDAALARNHEYAKNFKESDDRAAELEKTYNKLAFSLTEEGKAQAKAAEEAEGAAQKIKGLAGANEEAEKAAEDAAKAAEKQAERIKKTIENLKFETSILSLSADEQYALNQVRSAGTTIDTAAGKEIYNLAMAYNKEKTAIEEARKEAEKFKNFMSDESLNEMSIQLHTASVDIQKENLLSMEEYNKDLIDLSSDSADKVEGAWVHAAENIIDAWSNLFTDLITGEFSGLEEFSDGLGKSFASTFSNELVAGVKDGMEKATKARTSLLDGAMTGAMTGFNPWALAGSVAMTGLSSLLGDRGPSYGERLADSIDSQIEATKDNIQAMRDQMNETSALTIAVRELKAGISESQIAGTTATLAGSFKIPAGMMQRERSFLDGLKAVASAAFALPTGGASLGAMPQILDKGYTSYDYSKAGSSDITQALMDKIGLPAFLNVMKATTTDAGAFIDALKNNGLLNGEIPKRVLEYYSEGSSKAARNREVAEGIVSALTESLLEVGTATKQIVDDITSYADEFESRNMTAYDKAFKDIDATLGKNVDSAKEFFDSMLGLGYNIDDLTKEAGPAGGAMDQLTNATGLTKEEILTLVDAQKTYNRIVEETQQIYYENRQKTLRAMAEDIAAYTSPLSELEQAIKNISDRAEEHQTALVDNGMTLEVAKEQTDAWTASMSELIKTQMINDETRSLTIRLLQAQGKEEEARAMQLENELQGLRDKFGEFSGPMEDIVREVYRLEAAAEGLADAVSDIENARSAYKSAIQSKLDALLDQRSLIEDNYEAAKQAYIDALRRKIDEETALNESRIDGLNEAADAVRNLISETENMADAFESLIDTIKEYRNDLIASDTMIGIESRYKSARSQFNEAVQGMYSSDPEIVQESISKLPGLGDTLLELSRGMGGSESYRQDLARVLATMNTAEGIAGTKKTQAEAQIEALNNQAERLERQISILERHTSIYETMLAEVEGDSADTRTFEEIQAAYYEAQAAYNDTSLTTQIEYWQRELKSLTDIINSIQDLGTAQAHYQAALVSAIAGGYDDISGKLQAELDRLEELIAAQELIDNPVQPVPYAPLTTESFAGGGTVRGSSSGYSILTTFHGTEHITPDSQMKEVKEVLSEVKGVLIQIRDTAGDINKEGKRTQRMVDRVTQGQDYVRTQVVA